MWKKTKQNKKRPVAENISWNYLQKIKTGEDLSGTLSPSSCSSLVWDLCSSSRCSSCIMKIKHKLEQFWNEALTHVSNDHVLVLAFPKLCSHKGLPCLNVKFSSYYKIRLLSNRQREANRFMLHWKTDVSKLNKKSKKKSSFISPWH